MSFRAISYIHWAKTVGDDCEIRLHLSGMTPPPVDWLGVPDSFASLNYFEAYGDQEICGAIAARYGVRPEQVLMASGASEANFLICSAILAPGDKVAVETPGYEAFSRVVEALGAEVVPLVRTRAAGYQLSLRALDEVLERGVRLVVVSDLHNPTGVCLDREVLAAAAKRVEAADAWLLVDEVYLDFLFEDRPAVAASYGRRVISTASLTKVYGLGALRAGWALGSPALIQKAYRVRDYVGVTASGPSIMFTRVAFSRIERLAAWSAWRVAAGRAVMDRVFESDPRLSWIQPSGGCIGLIHLPTGISGQVLSDHLAAHHSTLVVPGEFFGAPQSIRVGFGQDPALVEEGLSRVQTALAELG